MSQQYEVRSDKDGEVAFTAYAVGLEAKLWQISNRKAAEKIARENADTESGETLYIQAA